MNSLLIDHAIQNIWCTPDQDRQLIIEPAKISPFDGVLNSINLFDTKISLPIANSKFHVYQIGNIFPELMGLDNSNGNWLSLSYACNTTNIIIDLYNDKGIQMPRVQSWYMVTADGNILLAIKEQKKININLNIEKIYARFYSNAYFNSNRQDPLRDFIFVGGGVVNNNNEILAMQALASPYTSYNGHVYSFVNGYMVSGIDLITTKPGDIVEFIYDSSIDNTLDLKFSDMHSFTSELDSARKYLVHHNLNSTEIKYHDDIDFFIITPQLNNRFTGVYYHRNLADAVRMVTHKDYSINAAYALGFLGDLTNLTLRMHVRKSGYSRPLVLEANRIEELYKLPDNKVIDAMVGLNSTMVNWTASNLEKSAYTELMGSSYVGITNKLIQDAYGYNLMSTLLGNTPNRNIGTAASPMFNIPYGLLANCVAYEYDANGLLLDYNQRFNSTVYTPNNSLTDQVEFIAGISNNSLIDEVYDQMSTQLDATLDYRFYTCQIVNGIPNKKWVDVTGSSNYLIRNNVANWAIDPNTTYTLIRSNKNILTYDLDLMADNSILKFSLIQRDINSIFKVMEIPLGELDIFMNGYSLIENIDYIVMFPEILIINKSYLNDVLNTAQKITIRFTGFCNSDLTRNTEADIGFIKYNLLSKNNKFDIRDDKVLRIVINGKMYNRDSLQFSEVNSGITVPNGNNGLPYSIRDIVVPLRGNAVDDTYTCRSISKIIDKRVSDYMTSYLPEPVMTGPNIVDGLHIVISPFCSKIIYDLKAGLITDPRMKLNYSDSDVVDICKNYEYLLAFDPTQINTELDSNYVEIHPHNLNQVINLDIYSYKFLTKVVSHYLRGRVDISHFVSLTT